MPNTDQINAALWCNVWRCGRDSSCHNSSGAAETGACVVELVTAIAPPCVAVAIAFCVAVMLAFAVAFKSSAICVALAPRAVPSH